MIILYTLHFAYVQDLIVHGKDDLKYITWKRVEEYEKWGLPLNMSKTKYVCTRDEPVKLSHEIKSIEEEKRLKDVKKTNESIIK